MARSLPIAIGVFIIMLPATAVVPLLYALTEARHGGVSELGRHLFMSVNLGGSLVAALGVGLLSDRLGRRKALLLPALGLYAAALLLLALPAPYVIHLGLRFVEGVAQMAVLVLAMTLAAESVPTNRHGRTMGLVAAAMSLGVATGSVLGGRVPADQPELVFLWGGVLMLLLIPPAALLLREPARAVPTAQTPLALIAEALRQKVLLIPYLFTFVDRLTVGFIISTVSLYFAERIGMSPAQIGLAMAAFLLPYGVLTYPAGRLCDRVSPVLLMSLGSLLYGIYLAALGFAAPAQVPWVMACGGVVAALMLAPSLVLVTRLAGPGHRATAMGGFHLAGSLGFMLGPLVSVATMSALRSAGHPPFPWVFVVIGSLELACVLLSLPWLIKIWRSGVDLSTPPAREADPQAAPLPAACPRGGQGV